MPQYSLAAVRKVNRTPLWPFLIVWTRIGDSRSSRY
jgi:hypothetical protein